MSRLPFLDHKTDLFVKQLEAYQREERRLFGGDAVLTELALWKGEDTTFYDFRKAQAGYMPLPKSHASTLTGHLSGQTPMPNFGQMGKVRERKDISGPQTLAELAWYNVDGIGQDGQEMMAYFDGVQERAIATGFRWILVEQPSLAMLANIRESNGRRAEGPVTMQDVLDGFRPYPVEYAPQMVPFYQFTNGRLDFAVVLITITPDSLVDDAGNVTGSTDGFYLLVRRGYTGLGAQWAGGGWWKFDADHTEMDKGNWNQTQGQVPMFRFVGEPSPGTPELPALARSLTMELGQIAVGLMNLRSARDHNLIQAGKSVNHVLGIDEEKHGIVITQQESGSITVGYPPVMGPDGRVIIPQIWNSSEGLVASQAFESVITASLEEAREIMVKQVTSGLDASGAKVKASFAEGTSPLLARLASTRQGGLNNFLNFYAQRLGIVNPTANVQVPRKFDLTSTIEAIDAMLSRLKRSWLRSPTLEKYLIMRAGDEAGMLPEDKALRTKIEAELEESATPTEPQDPLADDDPNIPGRTNPKAAPTAPGAPGNGQVAA